MTFIRALPHTHAMNDTTAESTWEARCRQCGSCCFEKYIDQRNKLIYTDIPCRYLDVATRRCRIYERRLTINPTCTKLTPELLPSLFWLPADCGYRPGPGPTPAKKVKQRR